MDVRDINELIVQEMSDMEIAKTLEIYGTHQVYSDGMTMLLRAPTEVT
jgi:hypothetical protein